MSAPARGCNRAESCVFGAPTPLAGLLRDLGEPNGPRRKGEAGHGKRSTHQADGRAEGQDQVGHRQGRERDPRRQPRQQPGRDVAERDLGAVGASDRTPVRRVRSRPVRRARRSRPVGRAVEAARRARREARRAARRVEARAARERSTPVRRARRSTPVRRETVDARAAGVGQRPCGPDGRTPGRSDQRRRIRPSNQSCGSESARGALLRSAPLRFSPEDGSRPAPEDPQHPCRVGTSGSRDLGPNRRAGSKGPVADSRRRREPRTGPAFRREEAVRRPARPSRLARRRGSDPLHRPADRTERILPGVGLDRGSDFEVVEEPLGDRKRRHELRQSPTSAGAAFRPSRNGVRGPRRAASGRVREAGFEPRASRAGPRRSRGRPAAEARLRVARVGIGATRLRRWRSRAAASDRLRSPRTAPRPPSRRGSTSGRGRLLPGHPRSRGPGPPSTMPSSGASTRSRATGARTPSLVRVSRLKGTKRTARRIAREKKEAGPGGGGHQVLLLVEVEETHGPQDEADALLEDEEERERRGAGRRSRGLSSGRGCSRPPPMNDMMTPDVRESERPVDPVDPASPLRRDGDLER